MNCTFIYFHICIVQIITALHFLLTVEVNVARSCLATILLFRQFCDQVGEKTWRRGGRANYYPGLGALKQTELFPDTHT